jgi:hypothetical protein
MKSSYPSYTSPSQVRYTDGCNLQNSSDEQSVRALKDNKSNQYRVGLGFEGGKDLTKSTKQNSNNTLTHPIDNLAQPKVVLLTEKKWDASDYVVPQMSNLVENHEYCVGYWTEVEEGGAGRESRDVSVR